jgi:hypothetical protein
MELDCERRDATSAEFPAGHEYHRFESRLITLIPAISTRAFSRIRSTLSRFVAEVSFRVFMFMNYSG